MKKLIAYNNDPKLKEAMIDQMKSHMEQDKLVRGTYGDASEGDSFKGCAVGCALDSLNIIEGKKENTDRHERYEDELGIPEILARLEDALFEEMSKEDSKTFPLNFLEAIPVGADLSNVFAKFVIWEWEDPTYGLAAIKKIQDDDEVFKCCADVVSLYKKYLNGDTILDSEWQALEDLADKLYYAWARAWARARARAGAWARAWARARAGAWAWAGAGAWAGARAWARARAGAGAREEYEKQIMVTANKLFELLADAPIEK